MLLNISNISLLSITILSLGVAPIFGQNEVGKVAEEQPQDDQIKIEFDEYGIEWCVIGDVDNEPFPGHRQSGAFEGLGGTQYPFRIARKELTTEEYFEFVVAYAPFYDGNPTWSDFTGWFIGGRWDGKKYIFTIWEGMELAPQRISARLAARYCNWLHNDKIIEEWAFDTGCYDASTFGWDENHDPTDDYTRLPGARYWIPLAGEMLKATYFDPEYGGPGQPGWWLFPNRSDVPMRLGPPPYEASPGTGGQSNGAAWDYLPYWGYRIGLYPTQQSAYGLLDTSGGEFETAFPVAFGSSIWTTERTFVNTQDEAGLASFAPLAYPSKPTAGLRLASPIPTNANGAP